LRGNDSLNLVNLCFAFTDFSKPIILSTNESVSNDNENNFLIKISRQSRLPEEIWQLKSLSRAYI
jgi:hypothetical protein